MGDDASPPLKPRLAISADQAQAIVARGVPGACVLGISELYGGEISAVFEIRLADAAPCILKVYPASMAWKMAKEVYVLGLLRDVSTPVPRILLADDTRSIIDLNFVLMTRLDGIVLGRHEAELSDAELFAVYAEMGASLRAINGVTLDGFGYIGPNGVWTSHATNRSYMSSQFERKLKEFVERGGGPALAERLQASIATRRHLLDAATLPRLCHYDLHAGNVLVTSSREPRLSGIIDVENATAGDPLMDIAKAIYYFKPLEKPQDAPKQAGLLAGYGALRPDWQNAIELYRLACTLELWCWRAQFGGREALAELTAELEGIDWR